MTDATTLIELLDRNRRRTDRSITYLDSDQVERRVPNAELHERALGILHHLQQMGAVKGDKLILFIANNEQFIDAFWAAVLGGIIPVPVAIGISDEHRHKLLRIVRKLGRPFLYTDSKTLERVQNFAEQADEQASFALLAGRTFLVDQLSDISKAGRPVTATAEEPAFIQFSSGSTSEPKGVVLTHGNILANARGSIEAGGFVEQDVSLSWMPLTHDMGLIGFHLIMFAANIQQYLMPTDLFIRRPLLWMEFASRKRATMTCSPNFGYRHFLKVLGDRSVDQWDLSSVRQIFNGAEPISVDLCDEFMRRMAGARLPKNSMYPVYGLAEASLAVTFPKPGADYRFRTFNRHHLGVGETAVEVLREDPSALDLMCVGRAVPYCEVRIADNEDVELDEERVGHIHIRGANVTRGYFEAPQTNAESFADGGWLRTGDLGLKLDQDLYITGRAKDIIFINGQNYYPHDLEQIAQNVPGLDLNKVAAAGVRKPDAATDEIVMFVLHRGSIAEFVELAGNVARLVNEQAGLEVGRVVPVKRIPKTTSGKLQRHLLAHSYIEGEFDAELAELEQLRAAKPAAGVTVGGLAQKLKQICDNALPDRRIGLQDNLFEIGVSSLKLIEIHENIDREFPGLVDLTELFDYPTVAELAEHLEKKLKDA